MKASAALKRIPMFSGLSREVMARLAASCLERDLAPGEVVVKEGTLGRELYVIASGKVEVVMGAGGPKEIVLATLGPGEFFGEMSVVECRARVATVRAMEATVLFSLNRADLLKLFEKAPDQFAMLMLNMARGLCGHLRKIDQTFAARAY